MTRLIFRPSDFQIAKEWKPFIDRHIMEVMVKVEGEVSADGMVHIAAPDLSPGDRVTVTLEKVVALEGKRILGRWEGQIQILPGFDDPIEGLEWAYE